MKMSKKKASVKIRLNPNCFVNINGTSFSGHFETIEDKGKAIKKWIGDEAWVTPEYAEKVIEGKRPIARIVGNAEKTEKDVKEEVPVKG